MSGQLLIGRGFADTMLRNSWPSQSIVATGSMVCAIGVTHLFWAFLQHTPFLPGFAAAIVSSHFAGRRAGLLATLIGAAGYAWFPPPLATGALPALLVGFVIVSGVFAWLVARRQEIEASLRSSEARLAEAQELAACGSWESNVRDGSEYWSDQVFRIFGIEPGSLQPTFKAFLRFLHPEDRFVVDACIQGALRDRQPFECEHRIVRPTGEIRHLHVRGRVVLDAQGEVIRIVGTSQDITPRKVAEERSLRNERRLHTIIDAEPACVKLVSAEGILLEMNRAGLEMLGVDNLSAVAGHPVETFIHPEDRDRFRQTHQTVLGGKSVRSEFRVVAIDGRERWVDSHLVPVDTLVEGRETRAVLAVTSDITERKRLEERLRQSHKMEAIGLLAGGVAHDFNNLLTAISGFTEVTIESLAEDDVRRDDLNEVAKAAQRAGLLTRQLLAVSRNQILHPTALDLNAMIIDLEKLLRRTIPENIELHLDLSSTLPAVRGDRGQLQQVLLNLAINGAEAMPRGGQLVLVTANLEVGGSATDENAALAPGRYVHLSVRDTGVGISAQAQARVFEPFFTTKEHGKGTGLGLATVYGIVKQSGGHISVTSTVGRGTTFDVYLPAVEETVAKASPPVRSPANVVGAQVVLLVEDDGAVRRFARSVLEKQGHRILEARDGDEALVVAREYPGEIGLLITDVLMPGLTGPRLAERLAQERPLMRVLYTSGYTEGVMKHAGLENGPALLPKPFLPADLLRSVDEVCRPA